MLEKGEKRKLIWAQKKTKKELKPTNFLKNIQDWFERDGME
jgi:hypothetical protein